MREQNSGKLNIAIAIYGLGTVTDNVANLIIDGDPQILNLMVNNQVIGKDGWRGQKKSITIVYNYDGGDLRVAAAKEGDVLTITPDMPKQLKPVSANTSTDDTKLSVLAATYGPDDVTYKVKNLISSNNTSSFVADNITFGDTWHGVSKTLVIVLGHGSKVKAAEVFTEKERCYINLNEIIPAL